MQKTRCLLLAGSIWLTVVAAGCSTGKNAVSCQDYLDCPSGHYCGPDKTCTFDCQSDKDCNGGTCSLVGQCSARPPDLGLPPADGGADGATMDTRPPDGPPADHPIAVDQGNPDQAPDHPIWPDTTPQPDGPLPDTPSLPDGPTTDGLPPQTCQAAVGKTCTQAGGQCGPSATCLITSSTLNTGICTCACTPDDPQTPLVNEDSCPELWQNSCGTVELSGGGSQPYCFRTCSPKLGASSCSAGIACHPRSGSVVALHSKAVCLLAGCTSGADCPVVTATVCDTATTPCPSGQSCIAVVSGQTTGYCAKPGTCDLASGLCDAHTLGQATAQVGDPCKDDTECGNAMRCSMELDQAKYYKKYLASCTDDNECCSGSCPAGSCAQGLCTVENRNGYCTVAGCAFASTLTVRQCPVGSTCNILWSGGLCLRSCTLGSAASCRGHAADLFGDYECRSWDNLSLGGVQVTATPVCDFGTYMNCAFLGSSPSSLDCTALGDMTNSTQMSCRSLDNKLKLNSHDPTGFCLDTTSSGSAFRSPLP